MEVMLRVYDLLTEDGVGIHALAKSPINGHKCNIEFLSLLKQKVGMDKDSFAFRVQSLLN